MKRNEFGRLFLRVCGIKIFWMSTDLLELEKLVTVPFDLVDLFYTPEQNCLPVLHTLLFSWER